MIEFDRRRRLFGPAHRTLVTLLFVLAGGIFSRAQLLPEKSSQAPPKPKRVPAEKPGIQEPEMARIPAGEFQMGSASGAEDEKPVRRIFVSEFYIAKYPVSNADYRRFVLAAGHRPPSSKEKGRPLWNGEDFLAQIGRQPVVRVSWDDAVAYCRWLSRATGKQYRLPTEAEREKAARGGLEEKKYPWGDEEPDEASAWFGKQWSGLLTLKDVDYGVANGYGLYGLAGNVNEWVADLYNAHAYAHSSPRDPQGPFGGLDRVVRGGSAFDEARRLRCAARGFKTPTERTLEVGFRVARN
jgi:formylglycine-generating enzyme required for sulfatase activity